MNIGNILKVAEAIEQASVPGLGFNLREPYTVNGLNGDRSPRHCGTVACIAGWACIIDGQPVDNFIGMDGWRVKLLPWATEYFDLSSNVASELMAPVDVIYYGRFDPSDTDAVRCLRNLAITGKVDWAAAMKPDDPAMPALPVKASQSRKPIGAS